MRSLRGHPDTSAHPDGKSGFISVKEAATFYPILKELTKYGYAEVKEDKQLKGAQKRRVCTLTPLGVEAYKIALEAWRSTIPYIYKAIEKDDLVFIEDIRMRLSKK